MKTRRDLKENKAAVGAGPKTEEGKEMLEEDDIALVKRSAEPWGRRGGWGGRGWGGRGRGGYGRRWG